MQVREQPLFSGFWAFENPGPDKVFLLDLLVSPSGKVCFFVVTQTVFWFLSPKPPSPCQCENSPLLGARGLHQRQYPAALLRRGSSSETPRTRLEVGSEALLQIILWA